MLKWLVGIPPNLQVRCHRGQRWNG